MPLVIPDEVLQEAGLGERDALIEFACRLFDAGKLSLGGAARLAGRSRVAFEEELLARRIPLARPDENDLADDLAALDLLGISA
jgi:predicted HTH domain antitoxin